MMGLERKIELFKKVKDIILNNLLYKGHEYENNKRGNAEYNGPIYFDPQGKDIFSSMNRHLEGDEVLKQLAEDMSKGTGLSEELDQHSNKEMPKYYGMDDKLIGY